MHIVIFCHSLISDWNHGNAHFLRGIVAELQARGHRTDVYEPENAWSVENLVKEYGTSPIDRFHKAYPNLKSHRYQPGALDLDEALDGADLVLVHEWNDPKLVGRIGQHRRRSTGYSLLFHDTHHRSVTDPEGISRYDLRYYDGVLAFGNSIAEVYRNHGWSRRTWTWHEAADIRVFDPLPRPMRVRDVVWIGNWGDDERTAELQEFLIDPVKNLRLSATIHGVRYPASAVSALKQAGIDYRGWLPNYEAPRVFAAHRLTVHVPRRPYATALRGVPTIRVFEALACGIPLISAPWDDDECLFRAGLDYLFAKDGEEMREMMRLLLNDEQYAAELARHGRQTILRWHTCAHRVDELLTIVGSLQGAESAAAGGQP